MVWRSIRAGGKTALSATGNNVLRSFRAIVARSSLTGGDWTPWEMRYSFVSLLSDSGVPVQTIARLVGHAGRSQVIEMVYLKQIRPVLLAGAEAMDRIFAEPDPNMLSIGRYKAAPE